MRLIQRYIFKILFYVFLRIIFCRGQITTHINSTHRRLKNYPDPSIVINECGSDSLRMYLINSPVVRAESLRFVKQGVSDTVRKVLLPWYNSCSFFEQCITRLRKDGKDFEASAYVTFYRCSLEYYEDTNAQTQVHKLQDRQQVRLLDSIFVQLAREICEKGTW